jgi:hypothetical protein
MQYHTIFVLNTQHGEHNRNKHTSSDVFISSDLKLPFAVCNSRALLPKLVT